MAEANDTSSGGTRLRAHFASVVAHEFRTPLSVILASADALDRYDHTLTVNQRRERVASIRAQVVQMNQLLEDVLSFGLGSATGAACRLQVVDVETLCRLVLAEIETADAHAHEVTLASRDTVRELSVDPALVRRIVTNLLSNAVKYSPPGTTVTIAIGFDGSRLDLVVSDAGIGIEPRDHARVFEPFQRGSNVGERAGTGLGLAIVRQAVALHGGSIELESMPGRGSRFAVSIPAEGARRA